MKSERDGSDGTSEESVASDRYLSRSRFLVLTGEAAVGITLAATAYALGPVARVRRRSTPFSPTPRG